MIRFRNIRIVPTHGLRRATISWELPAEVASGQVFVAFSVTGVKGSWITRNPAAPVNAGVGLYEDTQFVINNGSDVGYYRLLLARPGEDDIVSEPVGIFADMERSEYGLLHQIIQNEFLDMRAANGFPVYHCIPRTHGTPAANVDPDTDTAHGIECPNVDPDQASYDLPFVGGFFPPVLTWMRIISVRKDTFVDRPDGLSSAENNITKVRLLPWPRPRRGHMFVCPATDRRWLVSDDVMTFEFRGIYPIAFEADLKFLNQSDARYRFPVPAVDIKAYRKLRYWS